MPSNDEVLETTRRTDRGTAGWLSRTLVDKVQSSSLSDDLYIEEQEKLPYLKGSAHHLRVINPF